MLGLILVAGLVLRLRGIHDPVLDHPGWRQGDTAAIARNFALLEYNPLHPQTDYDGAPPNYVELELQIVPFLAATLYKIFGVHEIFGRLISVAFSLGAIALVALFARRLFASALAGAFAAALLAVYPGSVYYGRTFMPDTTMVFFLTAALYAGTLLLDEPANSWRGFWRAALLAAAALLAKPVAVVLLVVLAVVALARFGLAGALRQPRLWALCVVAILPYAAYDAYISHIAEWHWTRGITQLHVLPALWASLGSYPAFVEKLWLLRVAAGMLGTTMLGPVGLALFVLAWFLPVERKARPLLFAWLAGAIIYAFVVVTVEKVDYYLYLVLPLAALWTGAGIARAIERAPSGAPYRTGAAALALVAVLAVAVDGRHRVAPYYAYGKEVYRSAKALDATLPAGTLVVMGHYDPSVLYYIDRKGWEEDPYQWTPFDEQSAIRKGARYYIDIEHNRFARNVELYAWMQRFPVTWAGAWPVYETDDAKVLPGAQERWREFRRREKAGEAAKG